ncbi:hypothetical protein RQP46_003076 [Phenoliferia psychrophenolica]
MAPVPPQPPFRVHITSFGPFRQIKENPSYLATKNLGGTTLTHAPPAFPSSAATPPSLATPGATPLDGAAPAPAPRTILISTECIPTVYTSVNERVHALHGLFPAGDKSAVNSEISYDLILHVGVGRPGTAKLEMRGRRYGYLKTDAEEKLAPIAGPEGHERRGYVAAEWDGVGQVGIDGEELWTNVKSAVVRDWVKSKGVDHIETSDDAGLYLCEFSIFGSLGAAKRAARGGAETPVQFLHIPCEAFL